MDSALVAYMADPVDQIYCIGSVVGPHPFPMMVRDFQQVVGIEAREQFLEMTGNLPDIVTACVGGAMRNTLRDLYERQVRHHHYHAYELDLPVTQFTTAPEARVQQVPARDTPMVDHAAAALESGKRLEMAMCSLSPRLRQVAEGIRDGKSYSEIGVTLGISKQAAHKLAGAAITTLRENLASMGFQGIDTLGLLKSGCDVPPQSVREASRVPQSTAKAETTALPLKLPSLSS